MIEIWKNLNLKNQILSPQGFWNSPKPPIFIAQELGDSYSFELIERLVFLLSMDFGLYEELPSRFHLSMELPFFFLWESNENFKKNSPARICYYFCLVCGYLKKTPLSDCFFCTYFPKTLEDLAILYLSSFLFFFIKNASPRQCLALVKKLEEDEALVKKAAWIIFQKSQDTLIDFMNSKP